jgi:hypothetical protein
MKKNYQIQSLLTLALLVLAVTPRPAAAKVDPRFALGHLLETQYDQLDAELDDYDPDDYSPVAAKAQSAAFNRAKQDPRFALGYLVVTYYDNVKNDGTGDSTAGIQAAIEDAYDNKLAVFFPDGTYQVSDTLKAYNVSPWQRDRCKPKNPNHSSHHMLIGSALSKHRPVIRLAPSASKFNNAGKPRPVIAFHKLDASTEKCKPKRDRG